jgi:hypothetical protein
MTQPVWIEFVLLFLRHPSHVPANVAVLAGQCMYTMTEENRDAIRYFYGKTDAVQLLLDLIRTPPAEDRAMLGVLAAGILRNIRRTLTVEQIGDNPIPILNSMIAPVLVAYLDWDVQGAANYLATIAPRLLASVKVGELDMLLTRLYRNVVKNKLVCMSVKKKMMMCHRER